MSKPKIEDLIEEILIGDTQKSTLEFVQYLRVNGMLFEREKGLEYMGFCPLGDYIFLGELL